MVLGKVVQVAMDGVSRNVTLGSETFLLHRVEGVFEEAMADLSEEIGIDPFFAPDTTNRTAIVQDEELGVRSQSQVGVAAIRPYRPMIETQTAIPGSVKA